MKRPVTIPRTLPALLLVASFLFPAPLPAVAGEATLSAAPRWGLLARGGYYGVPNFVLDQLFEEHPDVDGTIFGGELRYYGDGGPAGNFSIGLGVDFGRSEGYGTWRESGDETPIVGGGEVDMVAGAITAYWDLFATSPFHFYIGAGGGIGYAEGRYLRDGEEINVDEFLPVIHLPVGLVLNLGNHFGIGAEARFIDGVSLGGVIRLSF